MDVLRDEKELYVVNHALGQGGERIEVFSIITDERPSHLLLPLRLKYLHSVTSEEINKLAYGAFNAIAVASPNKFYVTRSTSPLPPYGEHSNPLLKMVTDNLVKPTGVYWIEYNPTTKDILLKEAALGFA